MDVLELSTHKIDSSGAQYIELELDTVNNFTVFYVMLSISKKIDQNKLRATLSINGTNIISDSLISMNHYLTQYLHKDAYKAGSFTPNAPLFISLIEPHIFRQTNMGLPINRAFCSYIRLKLDFGESVTSANITVYGIGEYRITSKGYTGHFLLEPSLNTVGSETGKFDKDYYITGDKLLGVGYINNTRKAYPEIELAVENTTLFRDAVDFSLLNQSELPKLKSTNKSSTSLTKIDLSSINTVTELDENTSSINFDIGQNLPWHVDEFTAMLGANSSVRYISQSWGVLTSMQRLKPIEFIYRFSGINYKVLPYYTTFTAI